MASSSAMGAPLQRLTCVARLACATALLFLTLMAPRPLGDVRTAVLLLACALIVTLAQNRSAIPASWLCLGEALATAVLIGVNLPATTPCLPYLLIAPLAAGCFVGVRRVLLVIAIEGLTVLAFMLLDRHNGGETFALFQLLSPWLLTSLGIGLLGARLSAIGPIRRGADASYESARRIIGQLRSVAGQLPAGLDLVRMAEDVLTEIDGALAPESSVVLIGDLNGELRSLATQGGFTEANVNTWRDLITTSWQSRTPSCHLLPRRSPEGVRQVVVVPLLTHNSVVGAVLTFLSNPVKPDALSALATQLDRHALRLEAALAFDEVRRVATAEERRRLAAEIHDGIAQDAAALAYIVDDLLVGQEATDQGSKLRLLREGLDGLLAELRLSIYGLRNDAARAQGLPRALLQYSERIRMQSLMLIHCVVTGSNGHLPNHVEEEFFRIAQEAVTNSRKHSGGSNIWMRCHMEPSRTQLVIEDDGSWARGERADSFGIDVMRDRAQRIGAEISIEPRAGAGTRVAVTWQLKTADASDWRESRALASTASR